MNVFRMGDRSSMYTQSIRKHLKRAIMEKYGDDVTDVHFSIGERRGNEIPLSGGMWFKDDKKLEFEATFYVDEMAVTVGEVYTAYE